MRMRNLKLNHALPFSINFRIVRSHMLNFNFDGESFTASVNRCNSILPVHPPQTQYDDFMNKDNRCDLSASCNPSSLACLCTHMIDLPYMQTIQLVLSNRGVAPVPHPIHVHGHTFHVVHVGYLKYNPNTGFLLGFNTDVGGAGGSQCGSEETRTQDYSIRS